MPYHGSSSEYFLAEVEEDLENYGSGLPLSELRFESTILLLLSL